MNKIKRAVTDCESVVEYREGKHGINNLLTIFSAVSGRSIEDIADEYRNKGYAAFKNAVGEAVVEELRPIRERYEKLMADKEYLMQVIRSGDEKADRIGAGLYQVYRKIGLWKDNVRLCDYRQTDILIKDYETTAAIIADWQGIGATQGLLMRLTVNYDIVLPAHNHEKAAPNFEREHCILHPIGKKVPVAVSGEIFDRIIDINTILGYHKIVDDVIDEDKHRTIKAFLKGKYKKAAKRMPQFNAAVSAQYAKLRELEEYGCLTLKIGFMLRGNYGSGGCGGHPKSR